MQVIENNELFSAISNEEAANLNGGTLASGANYRVVAAAFGIAPALANNTTLLFTVDALREGRRDGGF